MNNSLFSKLFHIPFEKDLSKFRIHSSRIISREREKWEQFEEEEKPVFRE